MLQEDTTCYGQISTAGNLIVKTKCMRCTKKRKCIIGRTKIINKSQLFLHANL